MTGLIFMAVAIVAMVCAMGSGKNNGSAYNTGESLLG